MNEEKESYVISRIKKCYMAILKDKYLEAQDVMHAARFKLYFEIKKLYQLEVPVSDIAEATNLSRERIYQIISSTKDGDESDVS